MSSFLEFVLSLPRFISKALHLHYGQRNEPSTLQKAFLCSLLNSRGDSTLKAVDSGRHSYLELSASCSLYPQESNWSTLDKMAYSGDSAASSPDPLLELEADIRTLRRRVRRQGEFMRQMDVQGGHRLDRMEDEISSSRAEFAEALETLETRVTAAIESMNNRLDKMEEVLAKLWDDAGKAHDEGNPSSRAKQRHHQSIF